MLVVVGGDTDCAASVKTDYQCTELKDWHKKSDESFTRNPKNILRREGKELLPEKALSSFAEFEADGFLHVEIKARKFTRRDAVPNENRCAISGVPVMNPLRYRSILIKIGTIIRTRSTEGLQITPDDIIVIDYDNEEATTGEPR
jgi:hypothetical protein